MSRDLFTSVVEEAKLEPKFVILRDSPGYAPARHIMSEIFRSFIDVDGNFVEQFQTSGYDARIWELYLYAYFRNSGFELGYRYAQPDFMLRRYDFTAFVEAMTTNPSQGIQNNRIPSIEDLDPSKILDRTHTTYPIKLGSTLYSKLQKQYWKLPHVQNQPLVFALEDFHEQNVSLAFSGAPIANFLYGREFIPYYTLDRTLVIKSEPIKFHSPETKKIDSGFFNYPDAEHISAVLFSNSGTVTKFNRMGQQDKFRSESVIMLRYGTCYDHDPNASLPLFFSYIVGDPNFPESWGQGISIYHNPKALHPIPIEFFPDAAQHRLNDDNLLVSEVPDFSPIASQTFIFHKEQPN